MLIIVSPLALLFAAASVSTPSPGPGISEALANDRAGAVESLSYDLSFRIPQSKDEPIRGSEVVHFRLRAPRRIFLDFEQARDHVLAVRVSGHPIDFALLDGHLIVPPSVTTAGDNAIAIEFLSGDEPLNRNADFTYTLFVPAHAHLAFPCFDQPNLKARFKLTLDIPAGWQAVANGVEVSRQTTSPGRASFQFAETQPLSTYLFGFAAGKFSIETAGRSGRIFRMFHRETDAARVARNRDALFDLHARALAWLED